MKQRAHGSDADHNSEEAADRAKRRFLKVLVYTAPLLVSFSVADLEVQAQFPSVPGPPGPPGSQ